MSANAGLPKCVSAKWSFDAVGINYPARNYLYPVIKVGGMIRRFLEGDFSFAACFKDAPH